VKRSKHCARRIKILAAHVNSAQVGFSMLSPIGGNLTEIFISKTHVRGRKARIEAAFFEERMEHAGRNAKSNIAGNRGVN
jgi:hypothetical protein